MGRWLVIATLFACGSSGGKGSDAGPGAPADATPIPIGACGEIATFEDDATPDSFIHVDDQGSDETGDGSDAAPYATIATAVAAASPGTAIVIHEGSYPGGEFLSGVEGTGAAPIWIGGAAGEAKPVFSGGDFVIQFSGGRHLVIHDLEITGGSAGGINFDDQSEYANPEVARHVVFRDLYIHDVGSTGNQDCLKLSGLDDFYVLDSQLDDCGEGGSGIDMVGCHHGIIARNQLTTRSSSGVQGKGGTSDIFIYANRITDADQRALNLGGSTGFEFFRPPLSMGQPNSEAARLVAVANIIRGSVSPVAFVGCDACRVVNNTLLAPENWTARILQETTDMSGYEFVAARAGVFMNNLVVFERGQVSTDVNVGGNTEPETFTFASNLWFASDAPAQSQPNLPVAEADAVVGMDPLLDGDGRPSADSPARGAGQTTPDATGDANGECYEMPPTIGAFTAGG